LSQNNPSYFTEHFTSYGTTTVVLGIHPISDLCEGEEGKMSK